MQTLKELVSKVIKNKTDMTDIVTINGIEVEVQIKIKENDKNVERKKNM